MELPFYSKLTINAYLYRKTQETFQSHDYKMPYNLYTKLHKELSKNLFPVTKIALLFDSPSYIT